MVERGAVEPRREVEKHPFPERVLADDDLLDAELVDHLLENERTGHDDVGPFGLDAGDGLSLAGGRGRQ